jgi:hypothetical protein
MESLISKIDGELSKERSPLGLLDVSYFGARMDRLECRSKW